MGGKHIAGAHQAAVKQSQSRGHQHDQSGADDHKSSVRGIHAHLPHGLGGVVDTVRLAAGFKSLPERINSRPYRLKNLSGNGAGALTPARAVYAASSFAGREHEAYQALKRGSIDR